MCGQAWTLGSCMEARANCTPSSVGRSGCAAVATVLPSIWRQRAHRPAWLPSIQRATCGPKTCSAHAPRMSRNPFPRSQLTGASPPLALGTHQCSYQFYQSERPCETATSTVSRDASCIPWACLMWRYMAGQTWKRARMGAARAPAARRARPGGHSLQGCQQIPLA